VGLHDLLQYQKPTFSQRSWWWDYWYRLFLFKKNDGAAEDDSFSSEECDIVEVPAVDASQVGWSFTVSDGKEDEAGVADEDILPDSDKEADNVAAEACLVNGTAAGSSAVAAAGAGEVA
jgi:hypothetical protein